ncbi:PPK2 family polyphosphate kinase [Actinobaculum sp. 313]|uniref:PPK2 family polyphosphate kinase n=1 Tax=Actinobaculum sp. 313 TaxID=2495645 RepID=UPI000D528C97|nr:PPK2 family polyphosphate kinase [Actinobaculum sp. 313]AWE41853.1 PPK2 family polyphosphate--nucleotide phosphotransferase [Actinobaculum sp. 313]
MAKQQGLTSRRSSATRRLATNARWQASPSALLRVYPGTCLASLSHAATPGWKGTRLEAETYMAERGALLGNLQERLFAAAKVGADFRRVLVVVQGVDTAGKGGIARHVLGMIDPQGVQLHAFGVPDAEERRHHYLWRVEKALPAAGMIGLFDRSHYEDVLVARVEHLVPESVWAARYAEINRFEEELVAAGYVIIKVLLAISFEEQGARLLERLERPDKRWKYSPSDANAREKWNDYQTAYQAVLDQTSTSWAPWYLVPADNKWYARLAVTELIIEAMSRMDLGWPQATWQLEAQRHRLLTTIPADQATALQRRVAAKVRSAERAGDRVDAELSALRANRADQDTRPARPRHTKSAAASPNVAAGREPEIGKKGKAKAERSHLEQHNTVGSKRHDAVTPKEERTAGAKQASKKSTSKHKKSTSKHKKKLSKPSQSKKGNREVKGAAKKARKAKEKK